MNYRKEIDGLRALAVLPVILFHAGFQVFSGGFVGVDIFFVISGYLITTIIIEEKKRGGFDFVNFYERRARRILPALFIVMATCLPFAWYWMLPHAMKAFSQSLVAVSVYASNILFWKTSGYFETATEFKPLLHTWSLAVEEQFYLFFPIVFIALWKIGRGFLLTGLLFIFVYSLFVAQSGAYDNPIGTFYLLKTRAWELLIGSFVSYYLSSEDKTELNGIMGEILSMLGLGFIFYSIFYFDKNTPFPSLYTLLPTVGAALIILFSTTKTLVGRLLSNRIVVGVGLLSYSAYLWHQPLFAFARQQSSNVPSKILMGQLAVLALVLAYLSWKYVETPFRNRNRFSRKQVFIYGFVGSVFFIGVGLLGHYSNGYKNRIPESIFVANIELPRIDNGWCFYTVSSLSNLSLGENGLNCWIGEKSSRIKGVLYGDSFSAQYEPLWDKVGRDVNVSLNSITTNWCSPSLVDGYNGPIDNRAREQCSYNRKFLLNNASKYDFVVLGGDWGTVFSKDKIAEVFDLINELLKSTKFVVVMASPKQFDSNVFDLYQKSLWFGREFDISAISSHHDENAKKANDLMLEFSKKYNRVLFFDRDSIFSVNGINSDLTEDEIPFSLDGGHISIYGSLSAVPGLLSSVKYSEFKGMIRQLGLVHAY